MTFTIPGANGLAQELTDRFGEDKLRLDPYLESLTETIKIGKNHEVTLRLVRNDIILDGQKIGTVCERYYLVGEIRTSSERFDRSKSLLCHIPNKGDMKKFII